MSPRALGVVTGCAHQNEHPDLPLRDVLKDCVVEKWMGKGALYKQKPGLLKSS